MNARGFCAIGILHSKKEVNVGTLFRTADAYDISYIFTVGRRYSQQPGDTAKSWRHRPCFNFENMIDLITHLPQGCRLVGVENVPTARPLPSYCHPLAACYLLGAEDHGLTPDALALCHDLIIVPGSRHCLNVSVAGSIVLYDRFVKGQR